MANIVHTIAELNFVLMKTVCLKRNYEYDGYNLKIIMNARKRLDGIHHHDRAIQKL